MSSSLTNPSAKQVTFKGNDMCVEFIDGRKLFVPLAYFPKLSDATAKQRKQFKLSGGGRGIHWDDLDEDISVEGLLLGLGDRKVGSKKAETKRKAA